MHRLKLTYFDFDGGRGEPARLIMRFANIDFKDDRIAIADWPQIKTDYRYHQLPELEVDGTVLTQTNAINRFVGKLAGLYPTDNWQAALCDEIIDTADDALQLIARTFSMSEEDKKVAREAAVAGPLPMFLAGLNSALLAVVVSILWMAA